jgi:hypothetical protein
VRDDGDYHMGQTRTDASVLVRVRETQEYDVEVTTTGNGRDAAKLARRRFLDMTADEQAANSVGITERSFEADEELFDEDELAGEGDG